jgi:hypothetical protein
VHAQFTPFEGSTEVAKQRPAARDAGRHRVSSAVSAGWRFDSAAAKASLVG